MAESQKGRTKANTAGGGEWDTVLKLQWVSECSSQQYGCVRMLSSEMQILFPQSVFFFHKICLGKETVPWQFSFHAQETVTAQAKAAVLQARQEPVCKWTLKSESGCGRVTGVGGREFTFCCTMSSPAKWPIKAPISTNLPRVFLTLLPISRGAGWWCVPTWQTEKDSRCTQAGFQWALRSSLVNRFC